MLEHVKFGSIDKLVERNDCPFYPESDLYINYMDAMRRYSQRILSIFQ